MMCWDIMIFVFNRSNKFMLHKYFSDAALNPISICGDNSVDIEQGYIVNAGWPSRIPASSSHCTCTLTSSTGTAIHIYTYYLNFQVNLTCFSVRLVSIVNSLILILYSTHFFYIFKNIYLALKTDIVHIQ